MATTSENLQRWSQALLWVSIVLPLLGAAAAVARYYVERADKRLSAERTAQRLASLHSDLQETSQKTAGVETDLHRANAANETLRRDLSSSQAELQELKERAAPRRVSREQAARLRVASPDPPKSPLFVACRFMDGESCDYANTLADALREAGWEVAEVNRTSLTDFEGLRLCAGAPETTNQFKSVVAALTSADVEHHIGQVKENSISGEVEGAVYLVVGRKPLR